MLDAPQVAAVVPDAQQAAWRSASLPNAELLAPRAQAQEFGTILGRRAEKPSEMQQVEAAGRWFLVAPIPACSHPELEGLLAPAKISHRKLAMRLKLRRGQAEAADHSLRVEPVPAAC